MNIAKNLTLKALFCLIAIGLLVNAADAQLQRNEQLYQTGYPYIKYFQDRAQDAVMGFKGLTRSFQLYLGGGSYADEQMINYGAISYDQDILARVNLHNGNTDILDTYVSYFKQLSDPNNPIFNENSAYYDENHVAFNDGPYRAIRINGRNISGWWNEWDWIVDSGAAACWVVTALEAYEITRNNDYKNLAIFLGDYLLRLQDTDGGIRYGPRGMYHDSGPDFFWNMKSTEQCERSLFAFDALYQITYDYRYAQAAQELKWWLKGMYDKTVHLYHAVATFDGTQWVKKDFTYIVTDVVAFAPLEMMFGDQYFGATQEARDQEVDLMFAAIESRTAFLDTNNMPKLFRFSISQTGDYGSVEWSAQMALAYLRAGQIYSQRANTEKCQLYLNKYHALVNNLSQYFIIPVDSAQARVAPYASYLDGRVAGGVPTGTGYDTFNCQAALASACYAFAKAGFNPSVIGGGIGVPQNNAVLNLEEVPWHEKSAPYNSSGAATAQMIINYIRQGVLSPYEISQNQVYEYAKSPQALSGELNAVEIDKALGHFDPYDTLVSNWADSYDSLADGNPFQGYNFAVEYYDPASDPNALNNYMRDICHWMAYLVRKDPWQSDVLTLHPNTPAAVPLFGSYEHWVVIKGYAASANPCPEPFTNPYNTPDFTVYGFWFKDPSIDGIGRDTYKTAAECVSTYFVPVISQDIYNGRYVQVAEPPILMSRARVKVEKPAAKIENLQLAGISTGARASLAQPPKSNQKYDWQKIIDAHLLSDEEVTAAFSDTVQGKPIFVKRIDEKNADYYLIPYTKTTGRRNLLASGVIIIDAASGYFKEASWAKLPQKFLPVDKNSAIREVRRYIVNDYYLQLRKLNAQRRNRNYWQQSRELYLAYVKLLSYLNYAKADLFWQPGEYSNSPYKPYWQVDANGYTWVVTQEQKVFPQHSMEEAIKEIQNNRKLMLSLPKTR